MDYVKIAFANSESVREKLDSAGYSPKCAYDTGTNEYLFPLKYEVGHLLCSVYEKNAYIENSLHKYYNLKHTGLAANSDDFTYCQITQAFDDLYWDVDYDLNETRLQSLEFGFNIKVWKSASELLSRFYLYKYTPYWLNARNKTIGLRKFVMDNFTIKIYDKRLEANLPDDVLRIEVKYIGKELRRIGIQTPCDVFDTDKFQKLFSDFLKKFDRLIIVDDRFGNVADPSVVKDIGNMLEPTFWEQKFLTSDHKSNLKKKLLRLIERHNLNATSKRLRKLICDKFDEIFVDCSGNSIRVS